MEWNLVNTFTRFNPPQTDLLNNYTEWYMIIVQTKWYWCSDKNKAVCAEVITINERLKHIICDNMLPDCHNVTFSLNNTH